MRVICRFAMLAGMIAAVASAAEALPSPAVPGTEAAMRARLPQDEIIYFLLPDRFDNADPRNDRGGHTGDRSATGFDPTDKGFYHGGDLKGVIRRLGYIQDLGATAIWVGPVFTNKVVQGPPGHQSAGYHGYWITDFTHVDPHLGTDADFKALVDAAHARGLKVYLDIVVNHTADVIRYRECPTGTPCPYRSRADYPYARLGGVAGMPINRGFGGDEIGTPANFARLVDPRFAYTPLVPPDEARAKVPAWLNDPIYYHNRGNSTFAGENSTMGDFFGLDDLMTEHPRVVDGMIAIYGDWIDRFGIDGFRIDTARHVDPAFWRTFVPAMLARARTKGITNFHIFGEVAEHAVLPAVQAAHTRVDRLPAVLDFAFREAVLETVGGTGGTDRWATLFDGDSLYQDGEATAAMLPTFVSNHDDGRIAYAIRRAFSHATDAEVLQRVMLANALMLTLRGVPTIYAGDEQGFTGDGGDQDAREDMFASKVASYNDNAILGARNTAGAAHFGESNPLFAEIAKLARLRRTNPALSRGRQVLRVSGDRPGLLAISRFDPISGREYLLTFNTSFQPVAGRIQVDAASRRFTALVGACASHVMAEGSIEVRLPPLGYSVCKALP